MNSHLHSLSSRSRKSLSLTLTSMKSRTTTLPKTMQTLSNETSRLWNLKRLRLLILSITGFTTAVLCGCRARLLRLRLQLKCIRWIFQSSTKAVLFAGKKVIKLVQLSNVRNKNAKYNST